jgi:type IV secretion system protein VirB9
MKRETLPASLLLLMAVAALGAEIPAPSEHDARVRYVGYAKDEVTVVNVRRGTVTRIVLGEDERIAVAATGFAAECTKADLEWCIRADVGTNQIWVKPKENATVNNLELKTDKRDYSFEFRVLPNASSATPGGLHVADPMFRVIFRYPAQADSGEALGAEDAARQFEAREKALLDERLAAARPVARNWAYSVQVLKGAEDIVPSLVFDDGRFTYFRFANNREVPAIFYISPSGEEARINFHMEGDLAVVQRMGRRFVLRLGEAVVGVWNDHFDPDGVPPRDGTVVSGVARTIR